MFSSALPLLSVTVFSGVLAPHSWLSGLAWMDAGDVNLFSVLVLLLLILNLGVLIAIFVRLGSPVRPEMPTVLPAAPPPQPQPQLLPAPVDDAAVQVRFDEHRKQMVQVIELLDMINDNSNVNTDYLLEAFRGGASAAAPTRSQPASPAAATVAKKPSSPAETVKPAPEKAKPAPEQNKPEPAPVVAATPQPAAKAEAPQAPLDKAFYLLENRDENYEERLSEAVSLFEGELNTVQVGRAQTGLSEAYFWLGDVSTQKSAQKKYHGEGVKHGEKSIKLEPDSIEAHFWYAANIGAFGVANGIMSSLGSIGPLQKHGNLTLEMDRTFFYAAPLRLMGRFYHQVPGFMVSGDPKKMADTMLHEAVEVGGDFFLNHLFLAEFLADNRRKKEARQLLEGVVSQDPKIYPNYQKNVLQDCRKLLRRL